MTKTKERTIKIKEHTRFSFTYYTNAQNVAIALASSGYYVNLIQEGTTYILIIYTDRI